MTTNPGNIVRIRSRNGGRGSVYEANMWAQVYSNGLLKGNGILPNTSPDLNVRVGGTPTNPDVLIGETADGYKIALDVVGQQVIQLEPPVSNSRYAAIIAYTDDLALQSEDDNTTGSPSSCGLIVVYGNTAASPARPTDAQVRAAITADGATGSQAMYVVLGNILLTSTTTAVTNAQISAGANLAGLLADKISRESITADKIASATITSNKMSNSRATDANGWTIGPDGWTKRIWVGSNPAIGGRTPRKLRPSESLPSGMSPKQLSLQVSGTGTGGSSESLIFYPANLNGNSTSTTQTFDVMMVNITDGTVTPANICVYMKATRV